jgi:membrane glycosyltransferase
MIIGTALDWLFSMFIGPIMMIAQTMFIGGLAFGRRMVWDAPNREDRSISPREALHGLWPQLCFGIFASTVLLWFDPRTIWWALPAILPCLLAIPFTVLTASPRVGRAMIRARLCAIPEEIVA